MIWDDRQVFSFDFETSGSKPEYALQPWRVATEDAWVTSLVWQYLDENYKLVVHSMLDPTADDMRKMLTFAIRECRMGVGWNVQFDLQWLIAYGLEEEVFKLFWADGMLFYKHYDVEPEYDIARYRKRSYGLKACVALNFPEAAGYEENIDFHSTDPAERKKLLEYNEQDVEFTHVLSRAYFKRLTEQQQVAAMIECASIPHVALANLRGLPVDVIAAAELSAQLQSDADAALRELAKHGATAETLRSTAKLQKLMFDQWGLEPLKKTKGGADAVDKETLHELSFVDGRAKTVRAFRDALGNKAKFADAPLASAIYNGDGCTHPSGFIFGTYSGRMTYSSDQTGREINPKTGRPRNVKLQTGFAIHQIKRGLEYRSVLCAPPDYRMIEFDAASQEFRWMAIASGDKTMLRLCQPGEDAHGYMGAQIAEVDYRELVARVHAKDPVAKAQRQLGKIANLSLQYRTSPKKLLMVARVQYGLDMTLEQAQTIYDTYHQTYPGVRDYWARQIDQTMQQGYVETFAGRRVKVQGDWGGQLGWSMGSTAINYRIQGTGADQKYLAIATLHSIIREGEARFALDLHDGLTFFVPDVIADQWAIEAKGLLDGMDYESSWGFVPPVPMPFDCKMGYNFGSMAEVDFSKLKVAA